jgi:hypothetical protein
MPKLRILADDAMQRCTSLTASSTAGTMSVDYLLNPKKSLVHRALGSSLTWTVKWATPEVISALVVPFCDWSPTAVWRFRLTNEQPATNLLTYTEAPDNAAWTKTNGSVSAVNTIAAPSGVVAAEPFTGSGAAAGFISQVKSLTQNQAYAVSCFVKAGTYTGVVSISDVTQAGAVTFNLTSKTVAVSGIATNGKATDAGNGWYRLSATFTPTVATGNHTLQFGNFTATTVIYLWGMMLSTGALTSYYPSSGATTDTRPLGYIDAWQSYDYDSGFVLACPAPAFKLPGRWTLAQSMTAYAYGGGALARAWLPPTAATGMVVEVSDPGNVVGNLEATHLVAGAYWEPKVNADYGASITPLDTDKNSRNDAGDLVTEIGTRHVKLAFTMSKMAAADRDNLWELMRGNGSSIPVYINLAPEHDDLKYERMYSVYGKLVNKAAMALPSFKVAASTTEVESI